MFPTALRRALALAAVLTPALLSAQVEVLDHQRINDTLGNFTGPLTNVSQFGLASARLGDIDGDGTCDMAVGSALQEIWILRLNPDGTVKAQQRVAPGVGGFTATLSPPSQNWGSALAGLGDVDGDGVPDLAVGAPSLFTTFTTLPGSLWILFLNADGTVKGQIELSDGLNGIPMGTLAAGDGFGSSAALVGDLDGDGTPELAVGASADSTAGSGRGAMHLLSLASNGTVTYFHRIDGGDFTLAQLPVGGELGASLAALGDLDGNGVEDLLVGAPGRDRGFPGPQGAVLVLRLASNGSIVSTTRITNGSGGFGSSTADFLDFGRGVASLGDRDGDGNVDVAVGSPVDDDGGFERGAVWVVYLTASGLAKGRSKISDLSGCFEIELLDGDRFGFSVSTLDDLDGDGFDDLAVGAIWDGSGETGAIYNLFLGPELQASTTARNAGSNPMSYTCDAPVLGASVTLTVDTSLSGHGNALPIGFDTAFQLTLGGGQTLLALDLGGSGEILGLLPKAGPVAVFTLGIANDASLCGRRVYTQSLVYGTAFPFGLTNAQDWVIGH